MPARAPKQEVRDSRPLSTEEAFLETLHCAARFFKECGLKRIDEENETPRSVSYDLGKDCYLDIAIHEPTRVAYVTSNRDYAYKKEEALVTPEIKTPFGTIPPQTLYRVNATVKLLGEQTTGSHVFAISLTRKGTTAEPVYVELPMGTRDPIRFLALSLMGTIRMLANAHQEVAEAFAKHFLAEGQRMLNDSPGSEPINV